MPKLIEVLLRRSFQVLGLLLCTWSFAATANEELDALLQQLAGASLREAQALLPELEAQGGVSLLPLFESMLAGNLHVVESSADFYDRVENATGEMQTRALPAGELLPESEIAALDLRKVRVSNPLRTRLRAAIARLSLMQGSVEQRAEAAEKLLDQAGADTLPLLRDALTKESDSEVRELIQVGIALSLLQSAATPNEQDLALQSLSGRLEPAVRNVLVRIADGTQGEFTDMQRSSASRVLDDIDRRVGFYDMLEQLFFGLSLGSVLLLVAIGLSVTFGVMGVINMAHGEMLMLGAYTTYVVQQALPNHLNLSLWLSLPAAFLVAASAGVLIQRFVIRHLAGRPLETLLATFGISLILQQAVRTVFSPLNRRVQSPDWLSGSIDFNPVFSITSNRLCILVFALLVFVLLLLILKKTSLGLQVRAVTQNRDMARAMGIRTDLIDAVTFGLGSGVAGLAGVALSQLTNVGPNLGQAYIIDSFMVVVFGGVGNLFGTLVGAFTLGAANKFLEPITGSVLANILMLVAIILFIQKRPQGLFPQKGRSA
jgi:urea transport system permease protein